MRVLIIEDDSAMRAVLRDVLEREGYRVTERPDGTDAPVLAERERFDAVILDKEMAGPNGLDVLSFLRARLPAVPVIFVTAFGGRTVAEEAARRGAYSYLEKPFRMATILDTLAAIPMNHLGSDPGLGGDPGPPGSSFRR
jgi:DNA-binding NtrC family response regulator